MSDANAFLKNISAPADILMVNAPYTSLNFPNNGVAYLCEAFRNAGFVPAFADVSIAIANRHEQSPSHIKKYSYLSEETMGNFVDSHGSFREILNAFGDDFEEAAEQIANHPATVIGFSVNTFNNTASNWLAGLVREKAKHKVIIYGGCSCYDSVLCRQIFALPDYICVGDAEFTAPKLLAALLGGGDPGAVPGVMEIRAGNGRYVPGVRAENLDGLAWPRWREYDLAQYQPYVDKITLPVSPTRGCGWGHCNFCTEQNGEADFRIRSPESVMEEIRNNVEVNKITSFLLTDLKINSDHEILERFCDLVIESGLKIRMVGQFHVDKRFTVRLLAKMKAAGFPAVHFGLESGSDHVLKLMRKGYNVQIAERCFAYANEAGLPVNVNLMVGFPGETMEDIRETCAFLERNAKYMDIVDDVHICRILHGSPLWYEQEKFGVILGKEDKARDWVTADGTNNFSNRVIRRELVVNKLLSLGLSLSQWQRLPDGKVEDKGGLRSKSIEINLRNLESLPKPERVLVLRSCPVDRMNLIINLLAGILPGLRFDILVQHGFEQEFENSKHIGHIYKYSGGPLSKENVLSGTVKDISARNYDWLVIPTGGMPLPMYNNVFELADQMNAHKVITVTYNNVIVK